MSEPQNRASWLWVSVASCLALWACSKAQEPNALGGETNWLRSCEADAECSVGECLCGVCSRPCGDGDAGACEEGLQCRGIASDLYRQTCGIDPEVAGLCSPECDDDARCREGLVCDDGVCGPRPGGDAAGTLDGGGLDALSPPLNGGARGLLVDAHLALTPECTPALESPIGSGVGTLDISPGAEGGCTNPYRLNLRVRNLLDERVAVTRVDVLLTTLRGEVLVFDSVDPPLANPFSLSVTGSVPESLDGSPGIEGIVAEAIPPDYAQQLFSLVGDQIEIGARLGGETIGGQPAASDVFEYRVRICDGCLTRCASEFQPGGTIPDEITAGRCVDNAGVDERVCVDPDC